MNPLNSIRRERKKKIYIIFFILGLPNNFGCTFSIMRYSISFYQYFALLSRLLDTIFTLKPLQSVPFPLWDTLYHSTNILHCFQDYLIHFSSWNPYGSLHNRNNFQNQWFNLWSLLCMIHHQKYGISLN